MPHSFTNCASLPVAMMTRPSPGGKFLIGHEVGMGIADALGHVAGDKIIERLDFNVPTVNRPAR